MYEVGIVKSIEGATAGVIISREGSPCDHCTQDTCTVPEEGVETEADSDLLASLGGFLAFFTLMTQCWQLIPSIFNVISVILSLHD
jgi:hypothetical protein